MYNMKHDNGFRIIIRTKIKTSNTIKIKTSKYNKNKNK